MHTDIVIDWKDWEEEIKNHYGVIRIKSLKQIKDLLKTGSLLCTSTNKAHSERFKRWCLFYGFSYNLLTAIPMADLIQNKSNKTVKVLKSKIKKGKYKSFIFYNNTPIAVKSYFYLMSLTNLPIYFITKLPINKINLQEKL